MHTLKWITIALALLQGSWLIFDGGRALIVGDYVTPRSGPRVGQLGPWSYVVELVGLNPRGTFVKALHVLLGVAWMTALVVFHPRPAAGWYVLLICTIASLWYLPIGTWASLVVIALLLPPRIRGLQ